MEEDWETLGQKEQIRGASLDDQIEEIKGDRQETWARRRIEPPPKTPISDNIF